MHKLPYLLLALALAPATAQAATTFNFEQDLDGFTSPTPAQLTRETDHALLGAGSLRLTLPEKVDEVHAISPEFSVSSWTLYHVALRQETALGAQLQVGLELNATPASGAPETWRPASYLLLPGAGGGGLFGTFPDSVKARLTLTLRVPGPALGRSAVVDEIRITPHAPLIKEAGVNLYWDGGFELDTNDMTFWGGPPQKMEVSTDRPHGGSRCLQVEADRWTAVVFPSVPVQPRRLYRFSCWVRGTGAVHPGLHKLGTQDYANVTTSVMPRLAWAGSQEDPLRLQPDRWQRIEILTACESDRILWFNAYLVTQGGNLEVDDAELVSLAQ
jgi:hypothetical protein